MTAPGTLSAGPLDEGPAVRVGVQSVERLRRESVAAYLDTLPYFQVVGRVARYEDAVTLSDLERPTILLLDAGPDVRHAITGCQRVRERCPETGLAVTYGNLAPPEVTALREVGVDALVPYAHGLTSMVEVLRKLAAAMPAPAAPDPGLSGRQREVLLLLASGHNTAEIATVLGISRGTVESHKRQVYAKLGVASALQAVARAASYGLIDGRPAQSRVPQGAAQLPAPPAGWLPSGEPGRPLLAVVVGSDRGIVDRVVTTLVSHRVPVVRDAAPSWAEPAHALRWHRGRVARVLVDPAPDHWRVAAATWRRTVVVGSAGYRTDPRTAVANGAAALLRAEHLEEHLVPVLRLVVRGYTVIEHGAGSPWEPTGAARSGAQPSQPPALTAREYDILTSIGHSLTVRQTARRLGISVKTVENTQVHLFRKLGVHNRTEALAAAYGLGLLRPDTGP